MLKNKFCNEHRRAVDKIKKFKEEKKEIDNNFDIDGNNQYTNDKYDPNGFDIKDLHKDTKTRYDSNGFNKNSNNQHTNDKYDP